MFFGWRDRALASGAFVATVVVCAITVLMRLRGRTLVDVGLRAPRWR